MIVCALSGFSQSAGSSARAFSSSSRSFAASRSKMPPQQFERLLDFVDEILNFGAHGFLRSVLELPGRCM
jgi:hypothetical protein